MQHSSEASSELLQNAFMDADTIEPILWKHADPNIAERGTGLTPLYHASQLGHLDVTKMLCGAGANTNLATIDGRTPLSIASEEAHHEVVRFLCEARADVNQASDEGDAPLHVAAHVGHLEVARLLRE